MQSTCQCNSNTRRDAIVKGQQVMMMNRPEEPMTMETPVTIGHIGHHPIVRMEQCRTAIVMIKGEEKDVVWEAKVIGSRFASHASALLEGQQIPVGDVHTLLATLTEPQSPDVLLVPWHLLNEEANVFLDRVKHLSPGPVSERTVQLGTAPLPKGVPNFGPWGQPINAQEHLDRWVRVYPGWHSTATLFETFACDDGLSRRIAVLWSRSSVTPPMDVKQWSDTVSDACFLLAAALYPDVQATEPERRDGALYLDYLCSIIRAWGRQLG